MLTIALDATPLIGQRTGVGMVTAGVFEALARRRDLHLVSYAITWRGRRRLGPMLGPAISRGRLPMAARPLHAVWGRWDRPVLEWWTGPVDVAHGTNFVVPPTRRAAQVVTVHDLTPVRFPELCQPATLRFPGLMRRALRRGAWVHVHTQAVADEVVGLLGARPDRVRVVPPGVEAPMPPDERGTRRGPPFVLSLGRVEPRKDLTSLVRAFDQVAADRPDLELVIAGPAGWAEPALVAAMQAAHHRSRIRRIGWVSEEEKAELLGNASVFAYPSLYEGFGLPPLEAMAAGVPVVATDAGGLPEAVGSAALLVAVGDADALAGALAAAIDDDDRRRRLIDAGRAQAASFTWGRCAKGLHALYCDARQLRG